MAYLREEIKAGLIIVAALLVLSLSVILIGGRDFLEDFDRYFVKVMYTAGLEEGAPVKLGGVRVGRVLNVSVPQAAGEPITIEIGIKQGIPIFNGTRGLITQAGFVGDIYLLLSVANTTGGTLETGETIPADEQVQLPLLMARLDDISESVDGLIGDINRLFSPENVQEIERLLRNTNEAIRAGSSSLKEVASSLATVTDRTKLVLTDIDGILQDNREEVSLLVTRARETLEQAREAIGTLANAAALTGDMMAAFEETARSVGTTSQSVEKAVALRSEEIGNLIYAVEETAEDLREVLQEFKNKPWGVLYREEAGEE